MKAERMLPTSVDLFLKNLLKHSKHKDSAKTKMKFIESYVSNFVHGVRKGEVLTTKHFLLGFGLHSITDQEKPAQIASRLGHCTTYDKIMESETAQTQNFQKLS